MRVAAFAGSNRPGITVQTAQITQTIPAIWMPSHAHERAGLAGFNRALLPCLVMGIAVYIFAAFGALIALAISALLLGEVRRRIRQWRCPHLHYHVDAEGEAECAACEKLFGFRPPATSHRA
jgi:hypothetical protein